MYKTYCKRVHVRLMESTGLDQRYNQLLEISLDIRKIFYASMFCLKFPSTIYFGIINIPNAHGICSSHPKLLIYDYDTVA
ncbi:unnamed protein product [Absidia cylindrospora]